MLTARAIKDFLDEGVVLRWVHSGAQLADGLTKIMDNVFLRETLQRGWYKLHDELEVLKERSNTRNRLKWLRSQDNEKSQPNGNNNA
jgi:ribosomal protein L19